MSELSEEVIAVPYSSEFTGWILDHCNGAIPVPLDELNCLQLGGELYRVKLRKVEGIDSEYIDFEGHIVIARHGLKLSYFSSEVWSLNLEPLSGELQMKLGAKYLAKEYERNIRERI